MDFDTIAVLRIFGYSPVQPFYSSIQRDIQNWKYDKKSSIKLHGRNFQRQKYYQGL